MVEDSEGNGVPPLELFLVGSAARGMIFFSVDFLDGVWLEGKG